MANGADCTTLSIERIRAKIQIGSYYYVTTGLDDNAAGDILSFTINKSRSQPIANMSCQLAVWIDNDDALESFETVENNMGEMIIVNAGALGADDPDGFDSLPRLFTGYVTGVREQPHWSDARKYILDVTAEDVFARMRYMGKFSRRFKYADDAFATINSGVRRQGGNMTRLQRVPAGRKGVEYRHAGNSSLESSPLIKTPDWKPKTPEGVSKIKGSVADTSATSYSIEAEPPNLTMGKPEDSAVVNFYRISENDREKIPVTTVKEMQECCCFLNEPAPNGEYGLKEGDTSRSLSWESDPNGDGIIVRMQQAIPSRLTFVDPVTGAIANVQVDVIPPHDHRDMTRGGPAVAVYDTFGV